MTAENEYFITWMVYLVASLCLLGVLWRLCSLYINAIVGQVLILTYIAIVWTPARLAEGSENWVPAFMAAIMDTMAIGPDAAIARTIPILVTLGLLITISIAWRMYGPKIKLPF